MVVGIVASLSPAASGEARADEPISLRNSWAGPVGFFATGAPLAVDGPDGDTTAVDMLSQPADVEVTVPQVPAGGMLRAAYLYWGGSIPNSECADVMDIDDEVDFTGPGGVPTAVMADACFCSDAAAMSYDVQACVADVTTFIGGLAGTYTVDAFDALIDNGTTHNASFSIVLIYDDPTLSPRRVALYDGLLTMSVDITPQETITLDGLDIDSPPIGDLTWYALEGDVGGSSGEGVSVTGVPAGGWLPLSDAVNPAGNPMNHTINTTMPAQTDVLGVDIDQFSIDAALDASDTAVEVQYSAGMDKWWLVYNIVGVSVFEPVLSEGSAKDWALQDDVDGDGLVDPGDTVRYTIHLDNSGNADGTVTLSDPLPAEISSWVLIDAGGGNDASMGDTLVIEDIPLPVGSTADVVFDVVIDAPDGAMVLNVAEYTAEPSAVQGFLPAPPIPVSGMAQGSTGEPEDSGSSTGVADDAGTSTGPSTTEGGGDSDGGSGAAPASTTALPPPDDSGPGSTSGGSAGLPGQEVDSGCACRGTGSDAPTSVWIGGLMLGLRRRRSR